MTIRRALEFVLAFIHGIKECDDHAHMSTVARHAYDPTLAKHHGWLVRNGVHVAMWALPNRKQVLIH